MNKLRVTGIIMIVLGIAVPPSGQDNMRRRSLLKSLLAVA